MFDQILYTACVTPFDYNKNVDFQSLEKILRIQDESNNGIVLLGSTGEGMSLTDQERKEIVTFACDLKLDAKIMIAIPSYNLNVALEFINFCNDLAIDGYLLTTPIYAKPGVTGQIRWFEELLDRADHPCMLYNVPSRAGVRLHPEAVASLQHHRQFGAIKDSSGTIESIVDYKIAAPNIEIYCGDDYLLPSFAIEGALGLISVASNAWPSATRSYTKECIKGRKLKHKIWWQAGRDLFTSSNPIPIKALMKDLGIIKNDMVRLPLSMTDLASREVLMKHNDIIKQWEAGLNKPIIS
jgi:4-hydroxy-tetrahydrodipicolinate synthase